MKFLKHTMLLGSLAISMTGSLAADAASQEETDKKIHFSFSSSDSSSSCHPCTGATGPTGPTGAPGPIGPTGPIGLSTGNSIIPYATGDQIMIMDGDPSHVYPLAFNFTGTIFPFLSIVNGVIIQPDLINDVSFNLPEDRVISSLAANYTYARDVLGSNPPGIEVTVTVEIWIAPPENPTVFSPSGVQLTFPTFTTPAPASPLFLSAGPTDFSLFVRGGSRIILLFRSTSSAPLTVFLGGSASAGVRL